MKPKSKHEAISKLDDVLGEVNIDWDKKRLIINSFVKKLDHEQDNT